MALPAGPTVTAVVEPVSTDATPGSTAGRDREARLPYSGDAELVAGCLEGKPGAFAALMEQHQRRVYNLCYRFAGNHEDASDLTQEVFLRVHRGLHRFQGGSALSTWLYRIAVNVSLNHVNAKRPMTEPVEAERLHDIRSISPAELVSRGERSERVRAAIATLPNKQRATLILRIYHDLSHREISEVLGNSVGAVKANYFHALAKLRTALSSEPL